MHCSVALHRDNELPSLLNKSPVVPEMRRWQYGGYAFGRKGNSETVVSERPRYVAASSHSAFDVTLLQVDPLVTKVYSSRMLVDYFLLLSSTCFRHSRILQDIVLSHRV